METTGRRQLGRWLLAALLAGAGGAATAGAEEMKVYWKNGTRIEAEDGDVKLKLGGRLMSDHVLQDGDGTLEGAVGSLPDGHEIRRARLYMSGKLDDLWIFKLQYDFSGGGAEANDVYLGRDDGRTSVLVGHHKNFFGLEQRSSSKYITYIERGIPEIFLPVRDTGLGLLRHLPESRLTLGFGAMRSSDALGGSASSDAHAYSFRAHGQPVDRGADRFLHLGLSLAHRDPAGDTARLRARAKVHQGPRLVDTGAFSAAGLDVLGLEAAWVDGPFSIQGEYARAEADAPTLGDPSFSAWYLSLSYFLTGESRPYDRRLGAWKRPVPAERAGRRGRGAWEVALRYARLDLTDGAVTGGETDDLTLGVNWYLNPNMRVKLDYIRPELDGVGSADIVALRLGVDF